MSVQEIEKAITELTPEEISHLRKWFDQFREDGTSDSSIPAPGQSLYDAIQSVIGDLPIKEGGEPSSSRNAGEQFTDYLVQKKAEGRL